MNRLTALIVALAVAAPVGAEVAVHKDLAGRFLSFRTGVHLDKGRAYYWDRNGGASDDHYLELDGDGRGHSAPVAVVVPADKPQCDPAPMVVWSYQDSADINLAYSIWHPGGWRTPAILARLDGDDVGARLYLDPKGHVHAVWSLTGTVGSIYYSKYGDGHWSTPERISPGGIDCRNPEFLLTDGRDLNILWQDWSVRPVQTNSFLKESFDP